MDVGDGLMNARANVNVNEHTVHAEVHAVSPSVGRSTVSRGSSPFNRKVEVPAAHYVATISAASAGTTTTSTSLPHFAHPRTDLFHITTMAHPNMAIRDPNARGPLYVVWQGQTQRVMEAPRVSLVPSTGVRPAIFISAPVAQQRHVKTSTPYPPRRHEDEA